MMDLGPKIAHWVALLAIAGSVWAAPAWADGPIPRKVLFGNPDRAGLQVSPDGTRISFLAPVDGVLNVWVAPADKPEQAKPVTHDTHRGIRLYFWPFTGKHLLYLQDEGGNENFNLFRVDVDSGETKNLTPNKAVRAQVE